MPLDVSRPITRREFVIDYISPLVCHEIASASGDVEISILPFDELTYPTGLLVEGTGTFSLRWNAVRRAICYNVYRALAPGGPYQLISTCQAGRSYSDNPGAGTFYYRVSAITPEGETPLSPEVTATNPGEPPVDPGDCPSESGTDTQDGLLTPEDTDLGSLTPDPFVASHTDDFGSFAIGRFKIIYTGGAYKEDDNPNPGDWKFNSYDWFWDNGASSFDPDGGVGKFGASQAAVEALVPTGLEHEFYHTTAGDISVSFGRFGVATNPVAGAPNPTFQLKRTGSFPVFPLQVRIQDYNPSIWVGTCTANGSADPEWDGAFTDRLLGLPSFADWAIASAATINGIQINSADVYYITDHPTNASGFGWRLDIIFFDGVDFVIGWTGIKGIDDVPTGRYYRDGGCFTGPECLIIEEF